MILDCGTKTENPGKTFFYTEYKEKMVSFCSKNDLGSIPRWAGPGPFSVEFARSSCAYVGLFLEPHLLGIENLKNCLLNDS